MIRCEYFIDQLALHGIDTFFGVPDSLLKDMCSYIDTHAAPGKHLITANEGNAVAMACGHFLATRKSAVAYMQNSGQGNAINPLASLAHSDVFGLPCLILIGWRGEPGVKDEPQHIKQGAITLALLEALDIPHWVLSQSEAETAECIERTCDHLERSETPAAIIVKKNTFESHSHRNYHDIQPHMTREDALRLIVDCLSNDDIVISTTGMLSRELYEYREIISGEHHRDFLVVGSMGHASQIALAIALAKPKRRVFCLDGDGAAIMHLGGMAVIAAQNVPNFRHIIINNGAHDSVGGQPTVAANASLARIASACGYKTTIEATTREQAQKALLELSSAKGPALLEIRTRKGARANLGRPAVLPSDSKDAFMTHVSPPCN